MPRRWTTFFAAAVLVAPTAVVGTAQQEYIDELRARAEAGDAEAQVNLGLMYANGEDVPQDDPKAVRWFRLAADQGNAVAQAYLGLAYADGLGVPQDDAEAVRWYRAAGHHAKAKHNLKVMYADGRAVPEDEDEDGWKHDDATIDF